MYYEYWGLEKPPFDNVPDPSMYVESHASVENTIAETIFAIEEGDECIAVIVGDIGLGKTMSLRMTLDSLNQEKYKIAFITNPSIPFAQLLREIIGQLTGKICEEKRKVNLLEIFNKILFETIDEGKKVLIFIDEANAMTPTNLESLRLLTNMQDDNRNLFTIVLAGQMELARRLEHPKRANLFQRIGIYNQLNKIDSAELAKEYVETRLKLSGGTKKIFTEDVYRYLWEYSENGVPRLINKICKLCLKAGETNNLDEIDGEIIKQIGERFQKLSGPAVQKRASRTRPAKEVTTDKAQSKKDKKKKSVAEAKRKKDVKIPKPTKETPVDSEKSRIGKFKVKVNIPPHIIKQASSFSREYREKLAGILAAQALKKYPQLSSSPTDDPLVIWGETRDMILTKFEKEIKAANE